MPLRGRIVATLLLLLVAAPASADESRVALFGGYASEVRPSDRAGETSYGWGFGARLEHRFDVGLYVAGAFVAHVGSLERAEDKAGVSTYRVERHAGYLGPEVGWELEARWFLVRPYVGAGAWYVIQRTAVRNRELRDDGLSPYVLPGLFLGHRAATWTAGLDVRLPIATALPISEAAPTLFAVFAFTLPAAVTDGAR